MRRVHFMSKHDMEKIEKLEQPAALISIYDLDDDDQATPKIKEDLWTKVLRLLFHDIDQAFRYEKLFTPEQAKEIIEFLESEEVKYHAYDLVVHCYGGISRSAAVAKFVAEKYGLHFPEHYADYNRHVFTTLIMTDHAIKEGLDIWREGWV